MVNWHKFAEYLAQEKQIHFNILSVSSVAGGDIHQAFHLHTSEGDFFLKMNGAEKYALFTTEENSLNRLSATLSIVLPRVIGSGIFQQSSWLLLEFLQLSSKGDDLQRGKDLALLHQHCLPKKQFGWFEDNYIGNSLQKNNWQDNWVEFYSKNRLQPQLDDALEKSNNLKLKNLGAELIAQLPKYFQDYQPKPSYLHGDLWAGNSGFLADGSAVFYDPASYIGDRETDIAMSEMFGGFSAEFYKGYELVFPLDKDYSQRKTLYNLYHYLNHYNLFGGGYLNQSLNAISSCLRLIK